MPRSSIGRLKARAAHAIGAWRPAPVDLAEATLLAVTVPLYYLARGLIPIDPPAAVERARDVIRLEERLSIFVESDLQQFVLPAQWLTDALNQVYLYGHLPFIGVIAFWLYLRYRSWYVLFRNAFLVSAAMGLIVYFLWPVAPPRLLPELGFVDTITGEYGVDRPGTPALFVNHYAAVPSLHFGWNALAALVAALAVRNWLTIALAVLTPPVTLASIVLTANHFFADAIAGALFAALGLAAALAAREWLRRRRAARPFRADAGHIDWAGWALGASPPEA